jgi:hypothetical protein
MDPKETIEMITSQTTPAGTADAPYVPKPQPTSPAPADENASAEVLITEQEVLFGTAAAVTPRRESIGHRFVASLKRAMAVTPDASRPKRGDYPRRYQFLERSLMAREMDRL